MASDISLPLRQAIVTRLRADPNVTAVIPAAQVYGERTPATLTWPFVRYGQSDVGQTSGSVPLHVFSKAEFTDEAATIAAAIVESLDGKRLDLGDGRKADLNWPEAAGTQIIPDGDEADAWHAIVRFNVTVPRTCPA